MEEAAAELLETARQVLARLANYPGSTAQLASPTVAYRLTCFTVTAITGPPGSAIDIASWDETAPIRYRSEDLFGCDRNAANQHIFRLAIGRREDPHIRRARALDGARTSVP